MGRKDSARITFEFYVDRKEKQKQYLGQGESPEEK